MNASIELDFADGRYTCALPVPQINELQRKCEIGIGGLYQRLLKGRTPRLNDETGMLEMGLNAEGAEFYIADIVETIRHGLIGGGRGEVNGAEVRVTEALANKLVATYVLGKPIYQYWSMAASILIACIYGYEPEKKDEPAQAPAAETVDEPTAG
jgi:hypothetical protein